MSVVNTTTRTSPRTPLTLATLPDRDLDRHELLELARSVAADPGSWEPHVAFSDDHRHYVSLHRDAHVDVWVLCWTPTNDTGWHDHDVSSGAVAVTRGRLVEHNLAIGAPELRTEISAGTAYCFGPDHIHRMTGLAGSSGPEGSAGAAGAAPSGRAGSVSIHAYSPPLWRMGQYVVTRSGALRRTSVSYADELRPVTEPLDAPR